MARIVPLHPEPAVDPAGTLEAGLRTHLAIEAALRPWADSVLIAALWQCHDPTVRASILAELTERASRGAR